MTLFYDGSAQSHHRSRAQDPSRLHLRIHMDDGLCKVSWRTGHGDYHGLFTMGDAPGVRNCHLVKRSNLILKDAVESIRPGSSQ